MTTNEAHEHYGYRNDPTNADRDMERAIREDHRNGTHAASPHGGCALCDRDHPTNPYADGTGIPDMYGGYLLFAVMDDGGVLCESCVRDPSNPVHPEDDSRDGWGIAGWDTTGNTDSGVICDHCGRVLQEEWDENA